ncbi:transposase family protein [Streptosporangium nondiastaticum]|uniref:transposase family protein n=1 Tax=Streptosporangium nondiastaticum TaxID=35764 RepID=UPI0031F74CB3
MPRPGASPALSCPSTIPLSSRTLNHLADLIRAHRNRHRSRWRRLGPGRQAPLALAHLRNGDTHTRLTAGFDVGAATAWRYAQEAIVLLAAVTEDLTIAMPRIQRLVYAILDGTLIPIDRVADQRPYYSGKHKRHGVNARVIADIADRLVWASPALPGSTHDLTAARIHGIIDELTNSDVMTFVDKGYQGARGDVRTPFKRRRFRPELSRRQKAVNRADARIRARGERAIATLKTWKILAKLRCCPRRAIAIVQFILVLHHVEANRYAG